MIVRTKISLEEFELKKLEQVAHGASTTRMVEILKTFGLTPIQANKWLQGMRNLGNLLYEEGRWWSNRLSHEARRVLANLPDSPLWIGYWVLVEKLKMEPKLVSAQLSSLKEKGYATRAGRGRWYKTDKK